MAGMIGGRYGRTDGKHYVRRERRKVPRHLSLRRLQVLVFPMDDSEAGHPEEPIGVGVVTDISRGSIGLILDRLIPSGIAVMLVLSPERPVQHYLTASTIWSGLLPTSGRVIKTSSESDEFYRVGLKFQGESDEDQCKYVDSLIAISMG